MAHVTASHNLAQNQAYQPALSQSDSPNRAGCGLTPCQDAVFCLAQYRGLSQTYEPRRRSDIYRRLIDSQAAGIPNITLHSGTHA